jgi:hypothetical protein
MPAIFLLVGARMADLDVSYAVPQRQANGPRAARYFPRASMLSSHPKRPVKRNAVTDRIVLVLFDI